jgi:hypothetical protein
MRPYVSRFIKISLSHGVFQLTNSLVKPPVAELNMIFHIFYGTLSYWKIPRYFMEPELSLPGSQEPSNGPHPESDESNP